MRKTITIASNDDCNILVMRKLIDEAGFTSCYVKDAIGLLARLHQNRPDLILMDFCIPGGRATEIIRNIRQMTLMIPVPIFVLAEREYRFEASEVYDAGANAFLPKPVRKHLLLSLIARFLPNEPEIDTFYIQPAAASAKQGILAI